MTDRQIITRVATKSKSGYLDHYLTEIMETVWPLHYYYSASPNPNLLPSKASKFRTDSTAADFEPAVIILNTLIYNKHELMRLMTQQ